MCSRVFEKSSKEKANMVGAQVKRVDGLRCLLRKSLVRAF